MRQLFLCSIQHCMWRTSKSSSIISVLSVTTFLWSPFDVKLAAKYTASLVPASKKRWKTSALIAASCFKLKDVPTIRIFSSIALIHRIAQQPSRQSKSLRTTSSAVLSPLKNNWKKPLIGEDINAWVGSMLYSFLWEPIAKWQKILSVVYVKKKLSYGQSVGNVMSNFV